MAESETGASQPQDQSAGSWRNFVQVRGQTSLRFLTLSGCSSNGLAAGGLLSVI